MLRERVEDFIAHRADPAELHELLLECTNNGTVKGLTAVRRLYEGMYGGFTFNFELKAPALRQFDSYRESPELDVLRRPKDGRFPGVKRPWLTSSICSDFSA
jgi:hypothetical protein